jgi:hypothetical protein
VHSEDDLAFRATGLLEVQRWVGGGGRHVRVLARAELKRRVEEVRGMAGRITER